MASEAANIPQFDAVAYSKATRFLVLPFLIQLPDDEKQRRRLKLGISRKQCRKPFVGYLVTRSIYGNEMLQPEDFDWQPLFPDLKVRLAGGTLKDGVLARIEPQAQHAREAEASTLALQDKARADTEQQNLLIAREMMLSHFASILKLAGIPKAKKRAAKRSAKMLALVEARVQAENCHLSALLLTRWQEIGRGGIGAAPAEPITDFHAYLDKVEVSALNAMKER